MTNKDLIKQYVGTTGLSIPEYQFNKLNNNLKTSYLRKRIQATEASPEEYLSDFEIIALPDDIRTKYFNNIEIEAIEYLLDHTKEPEKLINILLSSEYFINNINLNGLRKLLIYSERAIPLTISAIRNEFGWKDKIIDVLLSSETFINNLDSKSISTILHHSSNLNKIINKLVSNENVINNLDIYSTNSIIYHSSEKEKIINILLSSKEFIINLDTMTANLIINSSSKPDKIKAILTKYGKA